MSVYKDGDHWRYRKVVHRMDGTKVRISGTPDINTEEHALLAELANVQREIAKELAERASVDVTEAADFTEVELSRYEAAARRAGVTLREFIISACDAVVAYEAAQEFREFAHCITRPDKIYTTWCESHHRPFGDCLPGDQPLGECPYTHEIPFMGCRTRWRGEVGDEVMWCDTHDQFSGACAYGIHCKPPASAIPKDPEPVF